MNIPNVISIMGLPIILYYFVSFFLLYNIFSQNMKFPYSIQYTLCVISFNSAMWELPIFIVQGNYGESFTTGLSYFLPLIVFVIGYNIRLILSKEVLRNWFISTIVYMWFVLSIMSHYWENLGVYYSIEYLSTFILRTITLWSLSILCYPYRGPAKWDIAKRIIK